MKIWKYFHFHDFKFELDWRCYLVIFCSQHIIFFSRIFYKIFKQINNLYISTNSNIITIFYELNFCLWNYKTWNIKLSLPSSFTASATTRTTTAATRTAGPGRTTATTRTRSPRPRPRSTTLRCHTAARPRAASSRGTAGSRCWLTSWSTSRTRPPRRYGLDTFLELRIAW